MKCKAHANCLCTALQAERMDATVSAAVLNEVGLLPTDIHRCNAHHNQMQLCGENQLSLQSSFARKPSVVYEISHRWSRTTTVCKHCVTVRTTFRVNVSMIH